jgi:hypothetical protein
MPVTVEPTPPPPGLSPVGGKPLIARFDGGQLSSGGGLLALREVERRLGIADRLAACIEDPRAPERVQHRLAAILRFRMLMIAAGYEDGSDADSLRHDPVFKLALDALPDGAALCSQATISRLEDLPDVRALLRMARAMVGMYCASFRQVPRRIVLDIDDTFDAVHGGQQLRLFNAYYDEYGFQPIVVFDGDGCPVAAMLRPARRPTGAEARAFLRRLVREIRSHWPRVEILIRADSHYCAPEVLDFCRAERLDFVLGVASTSTQPAGALGRLGQARGVAWRALGAARPPQCQGPRRCRDRARGARVALALPRHPPAPALTGRTRHFRGHRHLSVDNVRSWGVSANRGAEENLPSVRPPSSVVAGAEPRGSAPIQPRPRRDCGSCAEFRYRSRVRGAVVGVPSGGGRHRRSGVP